MTKFEKVADALSDSTRESGTWLRLTIIKDDYDNKIKYATRNLLSSSLEITNAFNTLDEVIAYYGLEI